ncbi:uncharacterized protein TRAVEDRAFT_66365 [Trametes versicolor FP-101664 SS1]|uniref:uncharacterized protein n=1 Tax=Trametes versicolor (strain FP-101664) TaxID=717944 RepID=UPI0004623B7C|nr:uncharacterized protein TRAVEDRAFT_66365 [Trametes versicolor FP-101664 SS1]EIW54842.1 hypothetical protein TRAVEDRAFT_66365 [Trametes versicolor FP-101664 SS1]
MSSPSASAPASTSSAPASGFSSLFQSAGGPPLILVCIAAGLLFGAFVGMFLMKRLRPTVVLQRAGGAGLGGEAKLGEKPRLYDIYVAPLGDGSEENPWAHISPFAALYLPSSDADVKTPQPPPPSPSALSRVTARLHWSARPSKGHVPPPPAPELRSLQLAVTVSMPNPALHAPKDVDITDDYAHDDPMPDCCIGTAVLPYRLDSV